MPTQQTLEAIVLVVSSIRGISGRRKLDSIMYLLQRLFISVPGLQLMEFIEVEGAPSCPQLEAILAEAAAQGLIGLNCEVVSATMESAAADQILPRVVQEDVATIARTLKSYDEAVIAEAAQMAYARFQGKTWEKVRKNTRCAAALLDSIGL